MDFRIFLKLNKYIKTKLLGLQSLYGKLARGQQKIKDIDFIVYIDNFEI